jgi:hypothetical protein
VAELNSAIAAHQRKNGAVAASDWADGVHIDTTAATDADNARSRWADPWCEGCAY